MSFNALDYRKEDIETIVNSFSKDSRFKKLAEECCELAKECLKENIDSNALLDEAGDVLIMMSQIFFMYGIDLETLKPFIDKKINRTFNRYNLFLKK